MTTHGDIFSFKMHDLMHDLAMQVAGNDCCYLNSKAKRHVGRPMHVSLERTAICLLGSLDASKVRTLILLPSIEYVGLSEEELSIVSNFKRLRVLKLSYSRLSKLSDSIGKLKHLRYLNLERCKRLTSLSKCIGSLVCLETLKLSCCDELELAPKAVSKLLNLRHLYIDGIEAFKDKTRVGLGKLTLRKYECVIYSNRLSSLANIVEIFLSMCRSSQFLPPLERLPFLKSLEIRRLQELECIHFEEGFLETAFFPSLERLVFGFCPLFRGWCKMGDDVNDTNCSRHLSLPSFPRLSQLSIYNCEKLTRMPAFPNLDKSLYLQDCRGEALEATINTAASKCSVDYCPPLSMLKSLGICSTIMGIEEIPKEWMQNLTSLQHLDIWSFGRRQFEVIETWFEEDVNYLSSLQKISFQRCQGLVALPDWICNLSSLQHIKISDCIDLASLHERMPQLTNLQTLEISACSLLIEECQTETSAIRPKIDHIPNIILKSSA